MIVSNEALLARYAEDRRGDRVKPLTPEHGRLFLPALRARHELELNPPQLEFCRQCGVNARGPHRSAASRMGKVEG
jgi:hypothetical protein